MAALVLFAITFWQIILWVWIQYSLIDIHLFVILELKGYYIRKAAKSKQILCWSSGEQFDICDFDKKSKMVCWGCWILFCRVKILPIPVYWNIQKIKYGIKDLVSNEIPGFNSMSIIQILCENDYRIIISCFLFYAMDPLWNRKEVRMNDQTSELSGLSIVMLLS